MAALGLALRDIDDMAEQSAERRAQHVDDIQRGRRRFYVRRHVDETGRRGCG